MYNRKNSMVAMFIATIMCIMCVYNVSQYSLAIEQINTLSYNLNNEHTNSVQLQEQLDMANETLNNLKSDEYELIYIGEYKISHYCIEEYDHICGNGDGFTATGTQIQAGRTIAVDSTYIPYGSSVYIDGYGWRVAEDCGGAIRGKHIDMAVDTHDEAMNNGVRHTGVWLLVKKS